MKNSKKLTMLAAVMALGSFQSFAGGEEVNCRTETVSQQAIYSGWASCRVNGNDIGQYVQPTAIGLIKLTEWNGSGYSQCNARVPFHSYVNVTKNVCDYKPTASIYTHRQEVETFIRASGSDKDGSIVTRELWIDDVKQSGSSVNKYYSTGKRLKLKAKVTDDQGYSDEKTTYFKVPVAECTQGGMSSC
jgi:hypothetical protein